MELYARCAVAVVYQSLCVGMVVPMLYAGMLLGGTPALQGLLVTLLLIAASFVANILAGVIALRMIKKVTQSR